MASTKDKEVPVEFRHNSPDAVKKQIEKNVYQNSNGEEDANNGKNKTSAQPSSSGQSAQNASSQANTRKEQDATMKPKGEYNEWKKVITKKRIYQGDTSPPAARRAKINRHSGNNSDNYYNVLDSQKVGIDVDVDMDCNIDRENQKELEQREVINRTDRSNNKIKKKFCPPIIIYDPNIKKINQTIQQDWPGHEYKIVKHRSNACKLYLDDVNVHQTIFQILRNNKFDAITFTPKEIKKITLIVKGIDSSYTVGEIKSEIKSILPNVDIENIKHFETKRNPDLDMFMIQVKQDQDIKALTSIRAILHQRVT